MAPSSTPADDAQSPASATHPPPASSISHPPRSLVREGACYFGNDDKQGYDTEPDDGPDPTTQARLAVLTTHSNIRAASQRYAAKKKLRPEQRDELDDFLSDALLERDAKLFVLLASLENKIDAQQSSEKS